MVQGETGCKYAFCEDVSMHSPITRISHFFQYNELEIHTRFFKQKNVNVTILSKLIFVLFRMFPSHLIFFSSLLSHSTSTAW